MRIILSIFTGAAAVCTGAVGAQEPRTPAPPRQPAPMRAPAPGCVTTDGKTECRVMRSSLMDSALMKRAALGVQLGSTGSVRDTLGVFVTHVTPKGPAENAGIIEGDRIVSINAVDLRLSSADAGDSYAAGLPARRLTREVAKLTPGAVANLRVYSAGRVRDVRVTMGRASDLMQGRRAFGFEFDGPGDAFMFRDGAMRMAPLERMRIESFEGLRHMDTEGMQRMRLEGFPRMRAPSRVRVIRPQGDMLLDRDGEILLEELEPLKEKSAAKPKTQKK